MPGKDKAQADGRRRIEYVPLGSVEQADRNAKAHDLAWIKSLIGRFGFVGAAVHDGRTGKIVAGHGRLESLQEMAAEGQSPPDGIVAGDGGAWAMPVEYGWSSRSDAEAEALAVALNEATTRGGWDERALAEILRDLDTADADLRRLAGWDDEAFAAFAESLSSDLGGDGPGEGNTDPDDVPEPPAAPQSRRGDVWLLGPHHRLVCGDSTDARNIEAALSGQPADCVWTDPPYGVAIVGGSHALPPEERLAQGGLTIQNDALDPAGLRELLAKAMGAAAAACKPGACWYVAAPARPLHLEFATVLRDLGIWRQTLVWVKDQFVFGRSDYHYRHEPIFYGWTPGAAHRAVPDRTQDTVWEIPRPKRSEQHPTMKPVELVARALENSTDPRGLVLDPFAGSGTTLIAAYQTGRVAALVEVDPLYCDVILSRFAAHTGIVPTLEATGEPFVPADPNPENRAA